jgi:hypothetical protein
MPNTVACIRSSTTRQLHIRSTRAHYLETWQIESFTKFHQLMQVQHATEKLIRTQQQATESDVT